MQSVPLDPWAALASFAVPPTSPNPYPSTAPQTEEDFRNLQYDFLRQLSGVQAPQMREAPVRPGEAGLVGAGALLAKLFGVKNRDIAAGVQGYMGARQNAADAQYKNQMQDAQMQSQHLQTEAQIAGSQADDLARAREAAQKRADAEHLRVIQEGSDLLQKLMSATSPEAAVAANNGLRAMGSKLAMGDAEIQGYAESIRKGLKTKEMLKQLPIWTGMLKQDGNPMARMVGAAGIRALLDENPQELISRGYDPFELRKLLTPENAGKATPGETLKGAQTAKANAQTDVIKLQGDWLRDTYGERMYQLYQQGDINQLRKEASGLNNKILKVRSQFIEPQMKAQIDHLNAMAAKAMKGDTTTGGKPIAEGTAAGWVGKYNGAESLMQAYGLELKSLMDKISTSDDPEVTAKLTEAANAIKLKMIVATADKQEAKTALKAAGIDPENLAPKGVDVAAERVRAQNSINAGADPKAVKARFKQKTGQDL